jgi:hypothetical protein
MAAAGGALSIRPEPPSPAKAEVRRAAGDDLAEMDRETPFHADEGRTDAEVRIPDAPAPPTGTWQAVEPGREISAREDIKPASLAPQGPGVAASLGRAERPPSSIRPVAFPPRRPGDAARDALLVFPRDLPVSLHASGLLLVKSPTGFATRLDAVRSLSYAVGQQSVVLPRRTRGRVLDEPLGGAASPLVELGGKVELVMVPGPGQRLWPVALEEEAIYLREEALSGFEGGVGYENGRLPVGDGDAIPMVQIRGPGTVVASVPEEVASIEVTEGRTTAVRAVSVIGWIGRVVPRGLLPSEAPGGVRGMVAFAGEGMVLIDAR